jgi:hypothetical protein
VRAERDLAVEAVVGDVAERDVDRHRRIIGVPDRIGGCTIAMQVRCRPAPRSGIARLALETPEAVCYFGGDCRIPR